LALKRVCSQENKELVGAKQVSALLKDADLPFGKSLCVEVVDSAYSKPAYLIANRDGSQPGDDCACTRHAHLLPCA
jgi:hypothetical protein